MNFYNQQHLYYVYAKTWNHRPLEVARVLSRRLTGTMRPLRSRPGPAKLSMLPGAAFAVALSFGSRSRCFAWPTSRNGEVSGASWANRDRRLPGNGKRARPRIAVWCRLGADIRTRTIPVHAKVRYGLTCLPEMTSNVEKNVLEKGTYLNQ